MKVIADQGCAEICCELGNYYADRQDWDEAVVWYYNAAYETGSILNLHSSGDVPLMGLVRCYDALKNEEQAKGYRQLAEEWKQENR